MTAISSEALHLQSLTPKQVVAELDRFIVGQQDAKRAVAIAHRNRWRRKKVGGALQAEITPKNILMVGPTGVGKTEIARRLAKLVGAPFVKVEATKFTEVGYVGRDVDSIIRDLVEVAIVMIRNTQRKAVEERAKLQAEVRILEVLVGENAGEETQEKFRTMLRSGEIQDKHITIEVNDTQPHSGVPTFDIPGMPGGQMGFINLGEMMGKMIGGNERKKMREMPIKEAMDVLTAEESDKLTDEDTIIKMALELVQNDGVVFIDEIDKIASRNDVRGGEISREGVQRDLLPLIEGSTVPTKYGTVNTDHILFIASGAFHLAKPSDLLPELQGRLPIRVELNALSEADLVRILEEPESSLLKQYIALLSVDHVTLVFTEEGIKKIAEIAAKVNQEVENIGARRLHTIMEKLLEEISFEATERNGETIRVDASYVEQKLQGLTQKIDLSKFIL